MKDHGSIRQLQDGRDNYLRTVYRRCNGDFLTGTSFKELEAEVGISGDEANATFNYLKSCGLVKMSTFGRVTLTVAGIDKVEREMTESYEKKEYLVLTTLFEKTRDDDVTAGELAKLIPVSEEDIYYILRDFLRKGWVEENFDATARITEFGVTLLHKWDRVNAPISPVIYNTTNYGDSNNIIGGQNHTLNVHTTNNADFDKAILAIVELLNTSSLSDGDKEEAITDVQNIAKLAANNPENAFERAKLRITAVETIVKGTEIAMKLAPYWPVLTSYFSQ